MMSVSLRTAVVGVFVVTVAVQGQGPGAGGAGMPTRTERKVVAQFDKDGNGRLNDAERQAAREWLAAQPVTGLMALARRAPGGGMPGRGYAPGVAGPRVMPADVKSGGAASLYDTKTVRTLFLQFPGTEWEREMEAFYSTDVDVPATVTVDGRIYRDVGVHYRGASSFMFVPAGSKRSLNLAFDFADGEQRLLGYRTVNLLNVNGDPTFVRALLYNDIGRQYLPMPKAAYARVVINGEYWGVYISAQQFNADFTKEAFDSRAGARWKTPGSPWGRAGMNYLGENPDAYRTLYEIKTKDSAESWTALIRLFRTLNETPADKLESALAPMLDVDGVLKFLALEMALVNTDGYWTRASDYSLYLDARGRFHVVPHDVNEAMMEESIGAGRPSPAGAAAGAAAGASPLPAPPPGMFNARVDLDPLYGLSDASKPLRSRLLAVPGLRAKYLRYVREIAERSLDWERLEPAARRYQALIAADVKADTRKLYSFERFQSDLAEGEHSIKSFVERRRAFLLKAIPK